MIVAGEYDLAGVENQLKRNLLLYPTTTNQAKCIPHSKRTKLGQGREGNTR